MKKLMFISALVLTVASALFIPMLFNAAAGLMLGAAFITFASEYNGQQTIDLILRPLFKAERPDRMGIKIVYTNRAQSIKMPVFDSRSKVLMPYAAGYQGGSGTTIREKKFTLAEFKAEMSNNKQTYKNTILEWITNKGGTAQNDMTGTSVLEAERAIFGEGLSEDIRRIFWLGDTNLRWQTSGTYNDATTTYVAGDVNKYYSTIDGLWKLLMADAATSPTAEQIKRTAMDNAAVAQARTETLSTGSGGTVGLTINGVAFTTTWSGSDAATATAICSAANITKALGLGVVMTNPSSAAITLVSAIAGVPFTMGTYYTGETSPLATWTASAITANTLPTALTTDEAVTAFKAMFRNANANLKALKGSGKLVIYATDTMIENYEDTLASSAYLESARRIMIDGISYITWNGIPIIPMSIDAWLAADFTYAYPNRAILTTKDNLVMVLSTGGGFAETRFWFNADANENRQRTQFEFGAGYMLPELLSIAY